MNQLKTISSKKLKERTKSEAEYKELMKEEEELYTSCSDDEDGGIVYRLKSNSKRRILRSDSAASFTSFSDEEIDDISASNTKPLRKTKGGSFQHLSPRERSELRSSILRTDSLSSEASHVYPILNDSTIADELMIVEGRSIVDEDNIPPDTTTSTSTTSTSSSTTNTALKAVLHVETNISRLPPGVSGSSKPLLEEVALAPNKIQINVKMNEIADFKF